LGLGGPYSGYPAATTATADNIHTQQPHLVCDKATTAKGNHNCPRAACETDNGYGASGGNPHTDGEGENGGAPGEEPQEAPAAEGKEGQGTRGKPEQSVYQATCAHLNPETTNTNGSNGGGQRGKTPRSQDRPPTRRNQTKRRPRTSTP